jgi:hypothetical protein
MTIRRTVRTSERLCIVRVFLAAPLRRLALLIELQRCSSGWRGPSSLLIPGSHPSSVGSDPTELHPDAVRWQTLHLDSRKPWLPLRRTTWTRFAIFASRSPVFVTLTSASLSSTWRTSIGLCIYFYPAHHRHYRLESITSFLCPTAGQERNEPLIEARTSPGGD